MKKKNIKIKSKTALNQVTLCWSVKKKIKTNSSLKLISGERGKCAQEDCNVCFAARKCVSHYMRKDLRLSDDESWRHVSSHLILKFVFSKYCVK